MTDEMSPGEVGRTLKRLEEGMVAISRKLDEFTQAGILKRVENLENWRTWLARSIFTGLVLLVVSVPTIILYAVK